ncbi:MAG: peptidoglycan-associated lipoprotein Pal [Acidobacteriota bacterium]
MKRALVLNLALLAVLALFSACGRRTPVATAPAPGGSAIDEPADVVTPAPTVELNASETSIERGQQTTLNWTSSNASSLVIDNGIGNVAEIGSLVVSPRESVTYTATATGPGGENRASTRVTVLDAPTDMGIDQSDIYNLKQAVERGLVQPVFFAYDKAELTAEARRTLEQNAQTFRRFPGARIIVEGHCDERGTEEYNLALGDRRAQATRNYLVQLGVDGAQLETISFGEERPFALGQDEAAYAQNRRAHFSVREF